MFFQVLDNKEQNFLKLLDNDSKPIKLLISKSGSELKYFGHSNSLCTRATRAIINHILIGEYHLIKKRIKLRIFRFSNCFLKM